MSDYPKCETCKHWTDPELAAGSFPEMNYPVHGRCQLAAFGSGQDAESRTMFADGNDGYQSWLRTLPNFGCVLHSDLADAGQPTP